MLIRLAVVMVYLLAMLAIGVVFRRRASRGREEYFLAGRTLGRILLFFTMAATNFSAFTIFGLSGAGYRIGYAFYPVMGFGTGFMALALWVIGSGVYRLSASRRYMTPSDYMFDRYGSLFLSRLFSAVMILFTLPYLAIQAIAAGRSLQSLAGLPYLVGALLITGFVVLYVLLGGMRSVAWTDVVQALMMVGFTVAGFLVIAGRNGGFLRAHAEIARGFPALLSRPGQDGSMVEGVWLGYMLLWLFADPMFPQLFQRFLAARDLKSLKTTVVLYPLITTGLFFVTVSIGVMGRLEFPSLPPEQTDSIYPLLLQRYVGPVLSTVLLTGGLAALMSTLDSQLLTLTSLITLDFGRRRPGRVPGAGSAPPPAGGRVVVDRLVTLALGAAAILIATKPPATILDFINRTSFYGLAVLAPAVIGGLYWKRANRYGATASILAGETAVVASYFGWITLPGVLPVVPVMAVSAGSLVLVSLATRPAGGNSSIVLPVGRGFSAGALVFGALFVLGNDFWAWRRQPVLVAGLPVWVWYFVALAVVLALCFRALPAAAGDGERSAPPTP
jgi:SSS family solute:Na+ symporter